jgi:hypothetical protein
MAMQPNQNRSATRVDTGGATVDFTKTPEFEAAVAKAAMALAAQNTGGVDEMVLARLATAIAGVTDRDTGRKHFPPELIESQKRANRAMTHLIGDMRARIKSLRAEGRIAEANAERPYYRILNEVVLHERKISPYRRNGDNKVVEQCVYWDGVPNEYMLPLNEPAIGIFKAFKASIAAPDGAHKDDPQIAPKEVWMSGTVCVVGDAAPVSARIGRSDGRDMANPALDASRFLDELDVQVAIDPGASHVHILGTNHAPAIQNVTGGGSARAAGA